MRSLAVRAASIRNFRNLAEVDLELGGGLNVFYGDNGQGKTNFLESVYVLGTSRSFRATRHAELIANGSHVASVRAQIHEGIENREQSVGLRSGVRTVRVNGKRPSSLAQYAVWTPMVVFHPAGLALATGSGGERRRLLDRIALYLSPTSQDERERYARASQARRRVLERRGEQASELESWEDLMVSHGTALSTARDAAALRLTEATQSAFLRIGDTSRSLVLRYQRGAPADPDAYRADLVRCRASDRARGSAWLGPHRDDLILELGGMLVRGTASQGQQRAVVIALALAEIGVIQQARGVHPVLLLDDVSSELDAARTRALFEALRSVDGQVLLTTTRRNLIDTEGLVAGDRRRDFRVEAGSIRAA
jgi:DNA replication and repair protein RecF